MPALFRLVFLLLAALLFSTPLARADDAPKVLVTIAPIHSLVARVMEGVGTPDLLVRGAASPHGMALKPSDAQKLERAGLVIRIGPQMEGFLNHALMKNDPTRVLTLMAAPGIVLLDDDPHIWLSPTNAAAMTNAIAERLAQIDPANRARYTANAAVTRQDIVHLQSRMTKELASVKGRPFVVFHDAYRYFEHAFALKNQGRVFAMTDRQPGAAHIQTLIRLMRAKAIPCLFTEPQFAPDLAFVIASETGARTGVLDPLGAALVPGPELYFQLMEQNARTLTACLNPDG